MAKNKFAITGKEIMFVLSIVLLGFVFTIKQVILFFDEVPIFVSFVIYELILYGYLFLMSRMGALTWKKKSLNFVQVFGAFLITFSLFVVLNWENPYVQYTSKGNFDGASSVFYGSEDAIVWEFWTLLIPTTSALSIQVLRILTFMITPAILSLVGVLLVDKIDLKGV